MLPAQVPLPATIRTELLDPVEADDDPDRADDQAYVPRSTTRWNGDPGRDGPTGAERTLPVFG